MGHPAKLCIHISDITILLISLFDSAVSEGNVSTERNSFN